MAAVQVNTSVRNCMRLKFSGKILFAAQGFVEVRQKDMNLAGAFMVAFITTSGAEGLGEILRRNERQLRKRDSKTLPNYD